MDGGSVGAAVVVGTIATVPFVAVVTFAATTASGTATVSFGQPGGRAPGSATAGTGTAGDAGMAASLGTITGGGVKLPVKFAACARPTAARTCANVTLCCVARRRAAYAVASSSKNFIGGTSDVHHVDTA